MDNRETNYQGSDDARDALQAFYDLHPYPPPIDDLDGYGQRWQDEIRRRADFHLHWPDRAYHTNLQVLIGGCGTSQAAKHAMRYPASHVVGIDVSQTSIRYSEALKSKYQLTNLELHQLPVERAGDLGHRFDKIVCTGVLHHLPDPEVGLRALREVLEPDGAINLMVYAFYGRAGVYMLQEYCRRLGIGHTDKEIQDLALTLMALPPHHPLARLLGESPDFRNKPGLADALLHPQDRAYTVPQLFELIERCRLKYGRWVRQAPYLPQCGRLAETPHATRLAKLPPMEQYASVELFRGAMLRHSLILYRDDRIFDPPRFDRDGWQSYVPIRPPEAITVRDRLPPAAAAVLINRSHTDPDLFLPIGASELQLVEAVNGKWSIAEIIHQVSLSGAGSPRQLTELARSFFERLWWYDQVMVDASYKGGDRYE